MALLSNDNVGHRITMQRKLVFNKTLLKVMTHLVTFGQPPAKKGQILSQKYLHYVLYSLASPMRLFLLIKY